MAGEIIAVVTLTRQVGLVSRIDDRLHLLKIHLNRPDHEYDNVLNIALRVMSGGGGAPLATTDVRK